MRRGRQLRRLAAWLGMVALLVQVLVPALLAAEINLAQEEHGQSVFTLCAFGHVHLGVPGDNTAPADAGHHDDAGALCPICLALLASPAFTAPPSVGLPLPVAVRLEVFVPVPSRPPTTAVATVYRSRAPPVG